MSSATNPPVALIVDDDPAFSVLCHYTLDRMGFDAMMAVSSKEGARLADLYADRIALLLVDVVLDVPRFNMAGERRPAGSDGTALLDLPRHRCPQAVTVQVSAYRSNELSQHGYRVTES